ncbi:MAG: BamA/TamA family outer membrane protein [Alistipes sp.]|nr:BamA/TamA family outer membrane protein [Alistipes sp.]
MNSFRAYILALLTLLSAEVMAQNDSILVIGRDTVAYRYTPIENSAGPTKERKGWNKFVNYVADSATDQSFERRVDMTFVPTLYYSPSTSVGLAVMATGRYRLDKQNRTIPASDFSLYATASLTGYYRVGVQGRNIFRNDNQRLIYNAEFYSMPTSFWGIGYDAAMSNAAMRYLASRTIVDVRFLQKVAKGLYLGIGADFNYHFGRFGGKRDFVSESDFVARLNGENIAYNATGISLYAEFDTRDIPTNPQRGVYLALQAKARPQVLNNVGETLWGGRLTFDYYQRLWRGAVLALDLRGEMNSQGTPWIYNAAIGGLQTMRGYYAGRFNDLCAVTLQAELRQNIYKRLGAVAWGGAGNVFHDFQSFSWDETLPTYGVGLRYEVRKGVNLRLDYGFGCRDNRGKLIHGALFSINEAF